MVLNRVKSKRMNDYVGNNIILCKSGVRQQNVTSISCLNNELWIYISFLFFLWCDIEEH